MKNWIFSCVMILSFAAQAQSVTPRLIPGRPLAAATRADGFEMQLLKNSTSNLYQYEFNSKNNLNSQAQNFDQVIAEQAMTSRILKSNLSQAEANQLFQFISQQKGIPFANVVMSYCFDRAQAIARLLEINGYQSQKIFAEGLFIFDSAFSRTGKVRWNSHVAATIQVINEQGEAETQVIDPSVADHLLKLSDWFNILTQYTAIGCGDGSGKVYGTGLGGCLFQVKDKHHYNGNDFSQDLQDWDATNWKTTVDIMKVYYQSQLMHNK